MGGDTDLTFRPAHELRGLIAGRQVSPVELVEASLRQIEAVNPRLNAFLTVAADQALAAAREAEAAVVRGDTLGPLHGVPVSIKDLEPAKGIRCTRGSLVFRDTIADRDEIAVGRLKRAGAIVVGKTNTPEFGRLGTTENRLGDDCRNPWDPALTTGGSSGGAAASVAGGMVPIAQGSDGGGSVRIPSSFCGIFGIKATQGRVPRRAQGLASWHPVNFSCIGPMTRSVRDAAVMLNVMAGPAGDAEHTTLPGAPPDFESALKFEGGNPLEGMRIALSPDFCGAGVGPEIRKQVEDAAAEMERLGAIVEPSEVDLAIDEVWQTYYTITAVKTAHAFGPMMDRSGDLLTDYVKADITAGRRTTTDRYHRALCELERVRACVGALFERYDLLVTPTTAVAAFPCRKNPGVIGGRHVNPRWGFYPFTFPFNMAGNPAANVPCGFTGDGKPVGLQLVGRRGDELSVLRASSALEAARPWADRRPGLAAGAA
jgi:Asp-tRNA(Asn)/Glu-tRNA(Gln) amidotransferase A subunit family amidase